MAERIKKSGRHSGSIVNVVGGRPKTPVIDKIAAKAWFYALMNASGSTNAYEVAKQYDASLDSKRFEKYARGEVCPTAGTLDAVDRKLDKDFGVKVRTVFDNGPEGVPLWDAMSGNFELLWDIIYKVSPTLNTMQATHEERVLEFMNTHFPASTQEPSENASASAVGQSPTANNHLYKVGEAINDLKQRYLNELKALESERDSLIIEQIEMMALESTDAERLKQEEWRRLSKINQELERHSAFMDGRRKHPNSIQAELRQHFNLHLRSKKGVNFTFQQLAATIALWRLSVLVSDSVYRLDTLMTVLLDEVIADMLEPYGVGKKVVEMLKAMQATYHRSLYP